MAKDDIKKFRHDISVLKKKGLVSGIDARSVRPTSRLRKLVDRFDDVLSGKATPIKLSSEVTKNMKAAEYDVYKGRVIFPHSAGEKITTKGGLPAVRQPNGVERITIPIPEQKLESYIEKARKNKKAIDAMKRNDEYFAFRFYGHQSNATFRNIDLLLEYFREYHSVERAIDEDDPEMMQEIYRNLEIVKVHRKRDWVEQGKRERRERGEYSPTAYQAARRRRERNPAQVADFNRKNAEKQKRHRERMNATQKEKYNKAGKKRAKKSRRKNAKERKPKRKT